MASSEVVETYYRGVDENGAVVYESVDVEELIHMCQGKTYVIQKRQKRIVVDDWKDMLAGDQALLINETLAKTNTAGRMREYG